MNPPRRSKIRRGESDQSVLVAGTAGEAAEDGVAVVRLEHTRKHGGAEVGAEVGADGDGVTGTIVADASLLQRGGDDRRRSSPRRAGSRVRLFAAREDDETASLLARRRPTRRIEPVRRGDGDDRSRERGGECPGRDSRRRRRRGRVRFASTRLARRRRRRRRRRRGRRRDRHARAVSASVRRGDRVWK